MKQTLGIYVIAHKKTFIPKSDYLIPMQAGACCAPERFEGYLHDDDPGGGYFRIK